MSRLLSALVALAVLAGAPLGAWQTKAAPPRRVPPAAANPIIVLETAKGAIEIELFRADAPKSVQYILGLAQKGFYRGHRFHRVERMLVQVGDPTSRNVTMRDWWGRSGADPVIGVGEISKSRQHVRGTVGLAHTGNPATASSQFYIMKAPSPVLDGKYTIIGRVTTGMAVVETLRVPDILKNVTVKK